MSMDRSHEKGRLRVEGNSVADLTDLSRQQQPYRLDHAFYDRVRAAKSQYRLLEKFVIPPYNGRAVIVRRGQTFRVTQHEGAQIGDVAFWNARNSREFFSSTRTWTIEGWFLRRYSRLWSNVPWFRPLATCVEETLDARRVDDDYHHHHVASHCAPELMEMFYGRAGLNACRVNLLQAIEPFGLREQDLHDNIDVFQKFRLDPATGRYHLVRGDGEPGDYIEFYAEIDLLVAVDVCPMGDGTNDWSKGGRAVVRPLGVEIYDSGIDSREFPAWTDWRGAGKGGSTAAESPR
jgi:uncharacterized protein YcgI (DUF1989 family)